MDDESSFSPLRQRDIIFIRMNMIDSHRQKEDEIRLLRLLAHPARLEILEILRIDEECVCHMAAVLGLRQAYLSQQLAVLREAGLIADRRDGWNIYYRLDDPRLLPLLDALSQTGGENPGTEKSRVVGEGCPCPKCSQARERSAN